MLNESTENYSSEEISGELEKIGSKIFINANNELGKAKNIILFQLKAFIAKHIWNNEGYYPIIHNIDNSFQKALEMINKPISTNAFAEQAIKKGNQS